MQTGFGLADAREADFAAEDDQGFKERRRVFAPADGHPDRLEHRTGFEAECLGGFAQSMVQRIVIEGRCGENFLGMLKDAEGHGRIATLGGDQLGRVVGGEVLQKEEVGGPDGIAQQLDALANERSDGEQFLGRGAEAGLLEEGLEAGAELLDGQGADVFGIEPDGFGVEWVFLSEIDHGVGAVDGLEREGRGELVEREELAVVLGRPAEEAEEVDESLRQEAGVAVGGDADDGAMAALGELSAVRRYEQRQMRELGRLGAKGLEDEQMFERVGEVVLPRMMWLMRRSASSTQEARW